MRTTQVQIVMASHVPVPPYVPDASETDEREAAALRRELRLQLREAARKN